MDAAARARAADGSAVGLRLPCATLQWLPPAAREERAFAAWLDARGDVQAQAARLASTVTGREPYDELVDYILRTSELPCPVVQRVLAERLTHSAMKKKFVSTRMQTRNEGKAESLDRWTDRMLDAATLDELFAE
jgi:hypothetical protein